MSCGQAAELEKCRRCSEGLPLSTLATRHHRGEEDCEACCSWLPPPGSFLLQRCRAAPSARLPHSLGLRWVCVHTSTLLLWKLSHVTTKWPTVRTCVLLSFRLFVPTRCLLVILRHLLHAFIYSLSPSDDTQRYHCGYCGCDITLRLKCAVCPDLDLCLQVCACVCGVCTDYLCNRACHTLLDPVFRRVKSLPPNTVHSI